MDRERERSERRRAEETNGARRIEADQQRGVEEGDRRHPPKERSAIGCDPRRERVGRRPSERGERDPDEPSHPVRRLTREKGPGYLLQRNRRRTYPGLTE